MTRDGRSGFSLIEVLLALGLLASVLVSIAGMFVVGANHVAGGRNSSEALAVARSIVEEIEGWGFHQTYLAFGKNGDAVSYTFDTRTNTQAARWQPFLSQKLSGSYATIDVASLASGSPPALKSTLALRVVVSVTWRENQRDRTVQLAMVRQ